MEEITPQSEFFHPFSLLFYNPKLPPFSTPVAHHNYEAGDQPCGRHAHIVAAEANRGERQQEGEREADAQVDEAGSRRDLDIACTLQKTAGDVGDRAGPDEEHQDVEMFLCAPQGLSGDVEDLEKRSVKKQNYDTDGDTDQDAHQDGGAVAAAGTVQFFSADILSGEAGNGDVKALGRDVRELFDLQHGSVALDAGSTEGVDETLQDEETDRIDACLQHDPASRVACEVMATHGHIIVAGEITTSAKPDVFNIVRDTLRDVGYDPKAYQIDCYIHDQSPDIAGAVEPELAEGEDEDTLGAGDQGVMVGYACNETPEYLPMPVVAAQRLVTLLEISRMTGVIPDIGPDGKVQVTMEYNGDTPVRITTVVVSVQHKEDTDINKLADLLDEYVFPLAFDGMPADDAEIILNPSGKFVQGGPDADTGLTGRKLMVDTYGTFAPHGGGAFSGKDPTKVDRSGAYMARYIAKNIVATHLATRCQVTLAYAIGQAEPVMVDVNTFGTCDACEDDCLAAAVRKAYDLTPAGIIKQLNLTNPIYKYTAAGGHFGRKDFPWEKVDNMSDFISYIQ